MQIIRGFLYRYIPLKTVAARGRVNGRGPKRALGGI